MPIIAAPFSGSRRSQSAQNNPSATPDPAAEQQGPDWQLDQYLWAQGLEALKRVAAIEKAKLRELKRYYSGLSYTSMFDPQINLLGQPVIKVKKDHVQVHFKDGSVLHHDRSGLHLGESQKVTAEVASVVMKVALAQWGGKCTISPDLSKAEQLILLKAAQDAGVEVANFKVKEPSMDLSEIVPTTAGPNPPAPPTTTTSNPPVPQPPQPPQDPPLPPTNPMDLGADPNPLAAYFSGLERKTRVLEVALRHEKMIGALIGRMLQADRINELVNDYRTGELFDASGKALKGVGVKLYPKGLSPQEKAKRIAELARRSPEAAREVANHYSRLMAQFDKDLALVDRIATDVTRATLTREAITLLVERNDRFFKALTVLPPKDAPPKADDDSIGRERTRSIKSMADIIRARRKKDQEEREERAKREAQERKEESARQLQQQREEGVRLQAEASRLGEPEKKVTSRGGGVANFVSAATKKLVKERNAEFDLAQTNTPPGRPGGRGSRGRSMGHER